MDLTLFKLAVTLDVIAGEREIHWPVRFVEARLSERQVRWWWNIEGFGVEERGES